MTTVRSPRGTRPRQRTRDGGEALRELLQAHEPLLAASAVAAGLGVLRPRSGPKRLAAEALGFLRLVAPGMGPRSRTAAIREEVRRGCLAAASLEDVSRIVALWRKVLPTILPGTAPGTDALLAASIDSLERAIKEAVRTAERDRVDVVVVGASAGGLTALEALLDPLDASLPGTLLVVLHVSERSPGLIPAVLARASSLEIAWAVDGASLQLGHVFVAPPGHHLVCAPEGLRVLATPPVRFLRPSIDVLFQSAAFTFGRRVLSVVLSGTGTDGAAGTQAVRAHGGLTLAQSPRSAQFSGMPEATIATGAVDRILSVERLGSTVRTAVSRGRRAMNA
jgi:two-component system chemotaxis response regulator CheB